MNELSSKSRMTCEEFDLVGLDSQRDISLRDDVRSRAAQHLASCSRCAELSASWKDARESLVDWKEKIQARPLPSRLETRLLQQFRLRHQFPRERKSARLTAWSIAAAALLILALGIWNWEKWRHLAPGNGNPDTAQSPALVSPANSDSIPDDADIFVAAAGSGDFTQLPGASSEALDDASIVRVAMQRGSLNALGLSVDEQSAGDWIQVDLLLGNDGSPQAVRLPQ
jgi:hypothetical protein